MPRVYLPLLPLPVLAILFAISCSRARTDEATHVIPPAAAFVEPAARNAAAAQVASAAAPVVAEEPPTADEVKAFERPVAK
jgi:hypothetical protein